MAKMMSGRGHANLGDVNLDVFAICEAAIIGLAGRH
jgi:hypothetical protein